jgi:hypothetical protein
VKNVQKDYDRHEEFNKTVLSNLGAEKKRNQRAISAQRDQLSDLRSYWRDRERNATNDILAGVRDLYVFSQVNLVFQVSGAVGWVFLIVGLAVGIIGAGEGDAPEP